MPAVGHCYELMKQEPYGPEPLKPNHSRSRPHVPTNGLSDSKSASENDTDPGSRLIEIAMPSMSGLAVTECSSNGKGAIKVLVLAVNSNQADDPNFSEDIARAALNRVISNRANRETV